MLDRQLGLALQGQVHKNQVHDRKYDKEHDEDRRRLGPARGWTREEQETKYRFKCDDYRDAHIPWEQLRMSRRHYLSPNVGSLCRFCFAWH
jgi:hypothetical protein